MTTTCCERGTIWAGSHAHAEVEYPQPSSRAGPAAASRIETSVYVVGPVAAKLPMLTTVPLLAGIATLHTRQLGCLKRRPPPFGALPKPNLLSRTAVPDKYYPRQCLAELGRPVRTDDALSEGGRDAVGEVVHACVIGVTHSH